MNARIRWRITLSALAVALLTTLAPGTAQAQGPVGDSVIADAADCFGTMPADCNVVGDLFRADVRSGPAGENPTGTVRHTSGFGMGRGFVDAQPTCLNVTGDTAIIGFAGRVTGFLAPEGIFITGLIRVVDRGGAGSRLDTFEFRRDQLSETPVPGPLDCSAFSGGDGVRVNEIGDIVVHDAPAVPTTKAQCQNGGWRDFPGFRNQGQCVAVVNRGPKP
jgi:hypothetical protein